jgi:hypothetical protein
MLYDLIAYGLLASIFIVTALCTLIDKPNKIGEISLRVKKTNQSKNH